MTWQERAAAYKALYYIDHKPKFQERTRLWRKANRERSNAHRHLLRLRNKANPTHANVRKMIELAAKFPKLRIYYGKS